MGFYSWLTQDTNKSISNTFSCRGTFPVNMINPKTGEVFHEENYQGYGEFGGKHFYDLMAELNGLPDRIGAIHLRYSEEGKNAVYPILVENVEGWERFKDKMPEECPDQGYFYDEWELEDEEDYDD